MDTPVQSIQMGYTDSFGKPIDNNIQNWFSYGVKPVRTEEKRGFCSQTQTLYVLVSVFCFLVVCVIIIVPVVIGNLNQKQTK